MSANQRIGPALRPGLFLGPDAVLVAGSGLIIRLRKDIVGSTPTRPTKDVKEGFRDFGALFLLHEAGYQARQYATSIAVLIELSNLIRLLEGGLYPSSSHRHRELPLI
jgi:hypothetical protein